MKIISDPSPAGDFKTDMYTKEVITLHFTAGYSYHSADVTLDKIDRVAVPFIVDVNGDIYHKFDKFFWAYHLGMKSDNPDHIQDKRSIPIEIVNIGPVWLKNGKYYDYVGREHPASDVIPGNDRGTNGGVKFPDAQINGLIDLMNALFEKVPTIPRRVPKDKISYQVPALLNFKGVLAHQHYRRDKYDTGIALPWSRIIEECDLVEV